MKTRELSKKEIELWIHYHNFLTKAIAIGGASLLLILIGIVPMMSKFIKTKQLLKQERNKLEILTKKVVVADNLDQNILEERVKLLNKVLPPTKDVVIYLNTLDSLAKEMNLSLGDVSLSPGIIYEDEESKQEQNKSKPKINQQGWQVLETELRIVGARDDIYDFLRQVEKTAPLMVIRDVQMSRVGSKLNKSNNFILTLKLGMVYATPRKDQILKGEIKLLTKEDEKVIAEVRNLKSYPLEFATSSISTERQERNNLFEPLDKIRSTNQSVPRQTEIPQPQLESSSESSESSRASQIQR